MDSDLSNPGLIAADARQILTYDYGSGQLRAYGKDGGSRWHSGRRGAGPGEFDNPTDIRVSESREVWVADPGNSRISIFNSNGRLKRTIVLDVAVDRLSLDMNGGFVATLAESGRAARFDSTGRRIGVVQMPAWMDSVASLVNEWRMTSVRANRQTVLISLYSGRMLRVSATEGRFTEVPTVAPRAYPVPIEYSPRANMTVRRLPPSARASAVSITTDQRRVYVLATDAASKTHRWIDVYSASTLQYIGSVRVSASLRALAANEAGVFALDEEPFPALVELQGLNRAER